MTSRLVLRREIKRTFLMDDEQSTIPLNEASAVETRHIPVLFLFYSLFQYATHITYITHEIGARNE
jgi:hypothetical protein